jgi:hypothetical protein
MKKDLLDMAFKLLGSLAILGTIVFINWFSS